HRHSAGDQERRCAAGGPGSPMTRQPQGGRPVPSATRRAVRLAAAAAALLAASVVAIAQQSWDPVVTTDAPQPKRPATPPLVVPKTKPAQVPVPLSEAVAAALAQSELKGVPKAQPAPSKIETGSIKGTPADEYCSNIANAAADARFAWQKKAL